MVLRIGRHVSGGETGFSSPPEHDEKRNDGSERMTHGSLNLAEEDRNPNEDTWTPSSCSRGDLDLSSSSFFITLCEGVIYRTAETYLQNTKVNGQE